MHRRLRGALVGYGFIAENGHLPAYLARQRERDDFEIVAVADFCAARRSVATRKLPSSIELFDDHRSLLRARGGELDFIDIATPPYMHAEIAHDSFDAGLHVLCEKPMTPTVEEAARLLAHARNVRRVFFPCHNYRHAPVIKAVRRILASGAIGKVRAVTLDTFRNTHAKGVPEWNRDWRRQREFSGGGIAMDHGSHSFYLAMEWLGGEPVAVTASMSTLGPHDTEDNFACTVTFNTGIASARLTWTAGVRKVLYTLQGDHGAITVEDDNIETATMIGTDGPDVAQGAVAWQFQREQVSSNWMDASHVTWFDAVLSEFADAIEHDEFVSPCARDAFVCVHLIAAAYASARSHSQEQALAEAAE